LAQLLATEAGRLRPGGGARHGLRAGERLGRGAVPRLSPLPTLLTAHRPDISTVTDFAAVDAFARAHRAP
jgi:hypothetical protein